MLLASVHARLQRQNSINQAMEAQRRAERVSAEEKLRLQTTALEAAANGIAITDLKGRVLWVNSAFTKLTGYESDEIIGQDFRTIEIRTSQTGILHEYLGRRSWPATSGAVNWSTNARTAAVIWRR